MRISDWSSDGCSSDLVEMRVEAEQRRGRRLAVAVDDEDAIALHREIMGEMGGDGRLADAALEILHRDDGGHVQRGASIGRASSREIVCTYGYSSVLPRPLTKNTTSKIETINTN